MRHIQKEPVTGLMLILGLFLLFYFPCDYTIKHVTWSSYPRVEATVLSIRTRPTMERQTARGTPRTVYYRTYFVEYQ